jgi:CO/xanthine dehydrogenase FAD-binding subunit
MRSNAAHYEMIAPPTLNDALRLLSEEPGLHLPIAGGTELMVAFAAGRLSARRLLSLNHLRELRFIDESEDAVTVGSGTTFTDLRRSAAIAKRFPLLAMAASWTGSVANQNRGTLGGNIVNGSPAADSPPALLVYEAKVQAVSARGMRVIPYRDFHVGYKKTALAEDELVHSIVLPALGVGWQGYIRKVGTRNAQAISKVALAGLAKAEDGFIREVRIGAASLREVPMRCVGTEAALIGQAANSQALAAARAALGEEAKPIGDIRSTARYRAAVAGNLLEEFLLGLGMDSTTLSGLLS